MLFKAALWRERRADFPREPELISACATDGAVMLPVCSALQVSVRTAAERANSPGEGREPSLCVGPRWELIAAFPFPTGSFLRTRFPRLTLKQPSRERNTNSPSTDEHERVDTLESEQTLWEKGGKKEKKKKKTVALETAVLPSTFT